MRSFASNRRGLITGSSAQLRDTGYLILDEDGAEFAGPLLRELGSQYEPPRFVSDSLNPAHKSRRLGGCSRWGRYMHLPRSPPSPYHPLLKGRGDSRDRGRDRGRVRKSLGGSWFVSTVSTTITNTTTNTTTNTIPPFPHIDTFLSIRGHQAASAILSGVSCAGEQLQKDICSSARVAHRT